MKRQLFQTTKVAPYEGGTTIDRLGFLSLIVAVTAAAAGAITLTVTHSDDGENFEPANDTRLEAADPPVIITGGVINVPGVESGDTVNVDIDLVGCKRYVAIEVGGEAGGDATCAYALGDPQNAPV